MSDTEEIALQLYSLREQAATDFPAMLRLAREAGYRAVELAGDGGLTPQRLRAELDSLDMRAISSHVPIARFERELDQVIEELHLLGCEQVVVPSMDPDQHASVAALTRLADRFDRWGERCRAEGLWFGYHNHDVEFGMLDGEVILDRLVAATEPALVGLQVDVFWVAVAGVDPVELILRYPGRIRSLHVKDRRADDGALDTTVGDGTLAWSTALAAARQAGPRWFIVEQEHFQGDPLEAISRSLHNLRSLVPPAG